MHKEETLCERRLCCGFVSKTCYSLYAYIRRSCDRRSSCMLISCDIIIRLHATLTPRQNYLDCNFPLSIDVHHPETGLKIINKSKKRIASSFCGLCERSWRCAGLCNKQETRN